MINCNTIFTFFSCKNHKKSTSPLSDNDWTHIELGAANYGANKNTDISYQPQKINPHQQLSILFQTLDTLIEAKGSRGVFYINDLHSDAVDNTIAIVKKFLEQKHPNHQIQLLPLVGNFFVINMPNVDSIHLKNPEYFFFTQLDNINFSSRLAYFSKKSKEGLSLITYFKSPLIHRLEATKVGCKIQSNPYENYQHVDGQTINSYGSTINFLVLPNKQIKKRLDKDEFIMEEKIRASKSYKIHMIFDLWPNESIIPAKFHLAAPAHYQK